jgi:hypothetical protein
MALVREAEYLYLYAKRLKEVNRKIRRLSKKAEKHKRKHEKTSNEDKRKKHKKRHSETTENIKDLIKLHNQILSTTKSHLIAYHDSLRKEHRLH